MDEIVRLSQEMGLYDADGPPPGKEAFRDKSDGSR